MNRYTIRGCKYGDTECPMSKLQDLENKIEDGVLVEVRHGYWTFKNTTYCHYGCFCSVCGKKSGIGGIRENQLKPYCPNCGAKMDGERKD